MLQAAGTPVQQRLVFNSGYIDFGSHRLINIDNISLTIEWAITSLYVQNSIKAQDKVRHNQNITLSGKLKQYTPELEQAIFAGSSTESTGEITLGTLDGQPSLINPVVTLFDRNGKEIQYQLQNAIFKSNMLTTRSESYGEWDFQLEAIDIVSVHDA